MGRGKGAKWAKNYRNESYRLFASVLLHADVDLAPASCV